VSPQPLRLGTRASALALAQARAVAAALGVDVELVEITTSGDRGVTDEDKSRWVKELEAALIAGEIDLAVHSAKDVPGALPEGLEIVSVPARADARDALCGAASLAGLATGARVGTSSLRRAAQLRATRPDLDVIPLRGNVDTRLRKLADGEADALVLAAAGLERLGRADAADHRLDAQEFVPAPGQGALALEARAHDDETRRIAAAISDGAAERALTTERALCAALNADCTTPLGAHATATGDGRLSLDAWVGLPDGSSWARDRLTGDEPATLGHTVAQRLLAAGAGELLAAAAQGAER
jgi:hydroxymethylbilane synthase